MRKSLLAILALSLFPFSAYSASYYANLGAGVSYPAYGITTHGNSNIIQYAPQSTLGNSAFSLTGVTWQNNFQAIYNANFALGMQITPHYRLEGEFFYQRFNRNVLGSYNWVEQNSLHGDNFANSLGVSTGSVTGIASLYSFMANAYYDYRNYTKLTPTVGVGLGMAYLWSAGNTTNGVLGMMDLTNPAVSQSVPTVSNVPSLSSSAFAWQIKAGFSYDASSDVVIVGMYRLFGTSRFNSHNSNMTINPGVAGAGGTFSVPGSSVRGMITNSFDISLRYYFL